MGGAGVDSEWNVSALMAKSLTWDRSAFARAPARRPRRRFENERSPGSLRVSAAAGLLSALMSTSPQAGEPGGRTRTGLSSFMP
jgi:hypothetical protein